MVVNTIEKTTPESGAAEVQPEAREGKLHKGPVAAPVGQGLQARRRVR